MATPDHLPERPPAVAYATRPAPGKQVNEDYVVAGPEWAVVLDGATAHVGVDTGCRHDVAWLVRGLAGALAARLAATANGSLTELLAGAIEEVRTAHGGRCDLGNPDSPSSTVAVTRHRRGVLECLVLADSPIVVRRRDGSIRVVDDDRLERLPGGRPYTPAHVRAHRNRTGGFWVAGAVPEAAYEAVTATFPVAELDTVAMFTDGVTRLVGHYGHDWPGMVGALRSRGPDHLIESVRAAERARPPAGAKPHDDATALLIAL